MPMIDKVQEGKLMDGKSCSMRNPSWQEQLTAVQLVSIGKDGLTTCFVVSIKSKSSPI